MRAARILWSRRRLRVLAGLIVSLAVMVSLLPVPGLSSGEGMPMAWSQGPVDSVDAPLRLETGPTGQRWGSPMRLSEPPVSPLARLSWGAPASWVSERLSLPWQESERWPSPPGGLMSLGGFRPHTRRTVSAGPALIAPFTTSQSSEARASGVLVPPAMAWPRVSRRLATIIVVTSTADSGPGTLRQALLDA